MQSIFERLSTIPVADNLIKHKKTRYATQREEHASSNIQIFQLKI